jgi:putative transport protein
MSIVADTSRRPRGEAVQRPRLSTKWVVLGLAIIAAAALLILLLETALQVEHPVRSALRGLLAYLQSQPFILLFATMSGGYILAKLQVRGISLGATAGTLIVALAVSLWATAAHDIDFEIADFASTLFFNLFMFSIGMKVGPQFLVGLHRGAKDYVILSVMVPIVATGLMLLVRLLIDVPAGMTAGIFAGANTATPGLGAAKAAYASGSVNADSAQAISNLSMSFAFSYCISTVLFIIVLKALPKLFGRDAVSDARAFEKLVAPDSVPLPGSAESLLPGTIPAERRVYRLERAELAGHTLKELRDAHPFLDIENIIRDGERLRLGEDTALRLGDLIAVFGTVPRLLPLVERVGPEIDDPRMPRLELPTVEVVQENAEVLGKTLTELARTAGHGLYLNAMFRAGEHIPRGPDVKIRRGDVLRVTGSPEHIAQLEAKVGRVVRRSLTTDILTLALGLCVGAAIGSLTLPLGGVQLSLGSVALLLIGVLFSTLRTRNPALGGPFPEPARQLLEDLGLNVFVAVLGLNAGSGVLEAIQAGALAPILIGSVVVGLPPAILAWTLGQYGLRMNTGELLGAVAGARCNSPGLRAAQEVCQSTVPAIAYPVTFAISNVLLTVISYFMALMD